MKITIVGAGQVGATACNFIAKKEIADEIILLDIKEGLAEGKSQDMMQTASLAGFDTKIVGCTNDYAATKDSTVTVITSGLPRKPGMTREDLINTNADIVKNVTENILKYSPNTIFVIVSNPMDTMSYLVFKHFGLSRNHVIGLGGVLDSARFKYQLSTHLRCSQSDLNCFVIGGHGDTTMIPLINHATWRSIPVKNILTAKQQEEVIANTMQGGAILTKLLGTSAWYAPGIAISAMVEAIVRDEKKLFACSVYLEGEYGQYDIFIGVPVVVCNTGWDRIIDLNLNADEKALFQKSADAIRVMNNVLGL